MSQTKVYKRREIFSKTADIAFSNLFGAPPPRQLSGPRGEVEIAGACGAGGSGGGGGEGGGEGGGANFGAPPPRQLPIPIGGEVEVGGGERGGGEGVGREADFAMSNLSGTPLIEPDRWVVGEERGGVTMENAAMTVTKQSFSSASPTFESNQTFVTTSGQLFLNLRLEKVNVGAPSHFDSKVCVCVCVCA